MSLNINKDVLMRLVNDSGVVSARCTRAKSKIWDEIAEHYVKATHTEGLPAKTLQRKWNRMVLKAKAKEAELKVELRRGVAEVAELDEFTKNILATQRGEVLPYFTDNDGEGAKASSYFEMLSDESDEDFDGDLSDMDQLQFAPGIKQSEYPPPRYPSYAPEPKHQSASWLHRDRVEYEKEKLNGLKKMTELNSANLDLAKERLERQREELELSRKSQESRRAKEEAEEEAAKLNLHAARMTMEAAAIRLEVAQIQKDIALAEREKSQFERDLARKKAQEHVL